MVKVVSNNVPRELLMWVDLPGTEQTWFDYIEGDSKFESRFVEYKGEWYDVFDSQNIQSPECTLPVGWGFRIEEGSPFEGWDLIISESFFSGVVFKFTTDDTVIVGRYFS